MGWKVRHRRPEDDARPEEFYSRPGAAVYEKNAMRKIQERILLRALQLVEIPEGARVLDAGCGTGFGMQLLGRLGYSVSGFDVSPDMVAIAKRKKLDAVVGDLRKIPFPGSSFDAVVSVSALQWVSVRQAGRVASEFVRVLRAGGCAVVQFYPASEEEALGYAKAFRARGFSVRMQTDSYSNARKRKVYLLLVKNQP
ncbi:MAG: class I SAM-dependent methyltransferase [Candidatus Micrarchaeota archaeon]